MAVGKQKSRYHNTKVYSDTVGINKGVSRRNTKYYRSIPEQDSDIYVMSQWGDRFDLLADQYYGDQHLWWYIAKANSMSFNNIPAGTTLRIPGTLDFI